MEAKGLARGLSCADIGMAQGGTLKSGFVSGFVTSFFSSDTELGGNNAEDFTLRATITGVMGGLAINCAVGHLPRLTYSSRWEYIREYEKEINPKKKNLNAKKAEQNTTKIYNYIVLLQTMQTLEAYQAFGYNLHLLSNHNTDVL